MVSAVRDTHKFRRWAVRLLVALWLAAIVTAAVTHGGHGSQELLEAAFAWTLVWFVVRFPRVVVGVAMMGVTLSSVMFAGPRARR
jgi:hypothetical protein